MTRSSLSAILMTAAVVIGTSHPASLRAQSLELAGRWTLNRTLSEIPREIGFGAEWQSGNSTGAPASGRGRRSGGASPGGAGGGLFPSSYESADDAQRMQQLTAEVRSPAARLTIAETAGTVTFTDDRGQSRAFHTAARYDEVQLDGVSVAVNAKAEGGRLVVTYEVEPGRQLRYTYSRAANPPQLLVDVQFLERGGGDHARLVYEPAREADAVAAAVPAAGQRSGGVPAAGAGGSAQAPPQTTPPAGRAPAEPFNQRPDAELKGLTTLGLVVEELSGPASACGLSQSAIETALAKRLSDAGFTIRRNSDEDTYVYVNVITTSPSLGFCVSRYDAFLYTHTTTKLSYQEVPVLVQVSLLHNGGIAGGASGPHTEAVMRGLQGYVDQFATRIRNAGK